MVIELLTVRSQEMVIEMFNEELNQHLRLYKLIGTYEENKLKVVNVHLADQIINLALVRVIAPLIGRQVARQIKEAIGKKNSIRNKELILDII